MAKKLNEKQYAAIALLTETDLMYEEVAEKVGCDVSTLRRWRSQDDFNDELKRQVMRAAVGDLPRVMRSIPDHIVDEGNAAMYRTFMQSLGLLTEKHEVNTKEEKANTDAVRAELARFKQRNNDEE
ncbi:phBC6A51 family helix-turn-helix protein [Thalassobacillus sp. CUG 92003]|uniref:phBC6A51 family helix-turn-helix protein n=1 Tax=Thalassobacillus sp. CUG 92003 TaxID=2736641 RepID=UPI0015E79499|nr:phBC6A51 family helix-turn-helix protein [Thalassobacillus sp. CUG 92003]